MIPSCALDNRSSMTDNKLIINKCEREVAMGMSDDTDKMNMAVKRFLLEYDSATKADICKGLNLSGFSAGGVLKNLLKTEEIIESDLKRSSTGALEISYILNYDHTLMLNIIAELDMIRYRVINLNRDIKLEDRVTVSGETHMEQLTDIIEKCVKLFPSLKTVMIGIPGNVNDGKIVYVAKNNYLVGRKIARELKQKCGIEISLYNDVNAKALGFYTNHREVSIKNDSMAYLCITSTGPGAGIILDGKILNGYSGFAGEIWGLYPKPEQLQEQVKGYVSAFICVVNPRCLALATEPPVSFDEQEIADFINSSFPEHCRPIVYFSSHGQEHYWEGLASLSLRQILVPPDERLVLYEADKIDIEEIK